MVSSPIRPTTTHPTLHSHSPHHSVLVYVFVCVSRLPSLLASATANGDSVAKQQHTTATSTVCVHVVQMGNSRFIARILANICVCSGANARRRLCVHRTEEEDTTPPQPRNRLSTRVMFVLRARRRVFNWIYLRPHPRRGKSATRDRAADEVRSGIYAVRLLCAGRVFVASIFV